MKIIYHNRKPVSKNKEKLLGVKYVTLDKLITQSDVISIHVPHTKENNQLFDMKIFKKMKKSAFLINTARGKIVNEKDLITALNKKIIAGAALDVYELEPISKKHPFTKIQNIVLAPHIGSSTKETRVKMAEITIKNLNLSNFIVFYFSSRYAAIFTNFLREIFYFYFATTHVKFSILKF